VDLHSYQPIPDLRTTLLTAFVIRELAIIIVNCLNCVFGNEESNNLQSFLVSVYMS